MQRVVHLPENRTVTLGSYVAAWKTVLAAPEDSTFKTASIGIQNHERKSCANFAADCMIALTAELTAFLGH